MVYYDEYGSKENPTILLLHGAGALDTFCRQYCFSDKYHLVVPHLAGAGKAAAKIYEPEKTVCELFTLIKSLHKKGIGVIGHSLGGQIAIMLVSKQPELFNFAVFLSAWVNPKPKTIWMYCSFAGLSAKMLHWKWLVLLQGKYWHYTRGQANNMAEYSKQITSLVYHSFFSNTLDLSKLPEYQAITIPMLAICGSKEVRDVKTSLTLPAQNPSCQTIALQGANHDFPMRNANQLNQILEKFILKCIVKRETE
ncbi:MAG: alpha/beta hydrolase [Lachnospiraceae bacterium]|nr:alpha/beta hydrolase [Lachnospiraceae bacterium]